LIVTRGQNAENRSGRAFKTDRRRRRNDFAAPDGFGGLQIHDVAESQISARRALRIRRNTAWRNADLLRENRDRKDKIKNYEKDKFVHKEISAGSAGAPGLKEIKRQTGVYNLRTRPVIDIEAQIAISRIRVGKPDKELHSEFIEFAFFDGEIIGKLRVEIGIPVIDDIRRVAR
jgi:hypothetical protein